MNFILILLFTLNSFIIQITTSDDTFFTREYKKTEYGIKFLPIASSDTVYIYGYNFIIDTIK